MKKVKSRIKISVALTPNIKEYLEKNFENCSKYVEYLIHKDMLESGVIDKKEFYINGENY